MKVDSYKCDQCGKVKGEVNHWFLSWPAKPGITVVPWGFGPAGGDSIRHLCGQQCVIAEVNQFMQGGPQ